MPLYDFWYDAMGSTKHHVGNALPKNVNPNPIMKKTIRQVENEKHSRKLVQILKNVVIMKDKKKKKKKTEAGTVKWKILESWQSSTIHGPGFWIRGESSF